MRRKTRPLLQSSDIALGLSHSFKSTINPQSWVMQCAPRLPSEVERSWAAWPALKYFIHLSKATAEVINKVCNAVNHFYSRHYTLIKLRFPQASCRQPQTQTPNASSPVNPMCLCQVIWLWHCSECCSSPQFASQALCILVFSRLSSLLVQGLHLISAPSPTEHKLTLY